VAAEMDEHHSLCLFSLKLGSISHRLIRSYTSLLDNLSSFSVMSELLFVLLLNKQTNRKVDRIEIRSIAVPCACCSDVAQILLGQKMHGHSCYICKETLSLLVKPFLGFPSADMNK
jgi:hypothetical protein